MHTRACENVLVPIDHDNQLTVALDESGDWARDRGRPVAEGGSPTACRRLQAYVYMYQCMYTVIMIMLRYINAWSNSVVICILCFAIAAGTGA